MSGKVDNSSIFLEERPWPNQRLKRAAIVGHTTKNSSRIWVRTAGLGRFKLIYWSKLLNASEFNDFAASLASVPFDISKNIECQPPDILAVDFEISSFDTDTTHVADLNNLEANTEYNYALWGKDEAGNQRILIGQKSQHSFVTLGNSQQTPLSFGLLSCHMPFSKSLFGRVETKNMDMWDYLGTALEKHAKTNLRLLIAGGDQVYVDGIDTLNIWKNLTTLMEQGIRPNPSEMKSWFREIYRGYWGFNQLQEVFRKYPTYMIWDDHELADGWGSLCLKGHKHEIRDLLSDFPNQHFDARKCRSIIADMIDAGKQVYFEYQHSHNPPTEKGVFDYHFEAGPCAFFVLDGRGQRDISRAEYKILGRDQLARFSTWCDTLEVEQTPFVFVVSAVPVMHAREQVVNASELASKIPYLDKLKDDLRDAWEHNLHDRERRELIDLLFSLAERGFKVSILSGDVHTAAVFELNRNNLIIYQLTSSAITFPLSKLNSFLLSQIVPDKGSSEDNYNFERLAFYEATNFSIIEVDPERGNATFQLYGQQTVDLDQRKWPKDLQTDQDSLRPKPATSSVAKIKLRFVS